MVNRITHINQAMRIVYRVGWLSGLALLLVVALSACNLTNPEPIATPTVPVILTPSIEPTDTPSPTPSPTREILLTPPTPIVTVVIASVEPRPTLAPSLIPSVEATQGPYVHVIQPQDTLGFILPQYGYFNSFDQNLISEIVTLNDNITNADFLPAPGNEILIPRQTATPIPEGLQLTQAFARDLGLEVAEGGSFVVAGTRFDCYNVSEGDTMVGIAERYDTTLEILSQQNPQYNWSGCNFTLYSGGPSCQPNLRVSDCVRVPVPTPVPTATATPSGNETATPTPTYPAPRLVYPANGVLATGGAFELHWTSVRVLEEAHEYLVEVQDQSTGETWRAVTRNTSIRLPDFLMPTDGLAHDMIWRVSTTRQMPDGTYQIVGGITDWRTFRWQGT